MQISINGQDITPYIGETTFTVGHPTQGKGMHDWSAFDHVPATWGEGITLSFDIDLTDPFILKLERMAEQEMKHRDYINRRIIEAIERRYGRS